MKMMPLYKLAVISIFMLQTPGFAQERTSVFDPQFLKTVVSIEQCNNTNVPLGCTNAHPLGTGFLLTSEDGSQTLLITAKHVILDSSGQIKQFLTYRFNEKTNASDLLNDDLLTINFGKWFISSNSDLACRFIPALPNSDILVVPYPILLSSKSVDVTAPVVILGFPMGLRSEHYATPIARHGIVARSDNGELVLDTFVFPGNSGGPVFYCPVLKVGANLTTPLFNSEKVIGVVVEYIPYVDVAISPQTQRPRITFEENSGLSIATPADRIIELLGRSDVQEMTRRLHDIQLHGSH
jgi:hypothetical protein